MKCDTCGIEMVSGARRRIWPKRCDACLRPPTERGPHIETFNNVSWNPQLGRWITSRKQRMEVIREVASRAEGARG